MNLLLTRIKFLFVKKGELFVSLKAILGFTPGCIKYYEQALTHRSMTQRDSKGRRNNNERLELLGDAVIETVISDILYRKYPDKDEGFMSTMRSKLVERKNLGRLATEIGMMKLLRTDLKQPSHNSYIGGNAFEALVGAIYLDKGYKGAQRFIDRLIAQGHINFAKTARVEENYKSLILEWGQKYKAHVRFLIVKEDDSNPKGKQFTCAIMVEGRQVATGNGFTKKESHQIASKKAWRAIHRNPNFEHSLLQMRLVRFVAVDLLQEIKQPKTDISIAREPES